MKKGIIKIFTLSLLMTGVFTSCEKKLDLLPQNDLTPLQIYATKQGYKEVFTKLYAGFALTGNSGPAGSADIQGFDEGFSDFSRCFWKAQELSTDEAVIAWGDAGIQDFHNMNWSADNPYLTGLYYRSFYQITLSNNFLVQASDANLASHGITGTDADEIKKYRPEARFIRAFQYWVLMDLYGNPAFVNDENFVDVVVNGKYPPQISRSDLFNYVESELKAIEADLPDPRTNEYGRVDKAGVWSLLARLYLNAEVYTGTERYTDAITYSKKVIDAGYTLKDNYRDLMLADNNLDNNEFIFAINFDGIHTQSYGGTTFLTHASVGGSMPAAASGVNGGWGGIRTTSAISGLFKDGFASDLRGQFYTNGQSEEIKDQTKFTDGYAVTKYRNVKRDGTAGQNLDYADIDFPLFRLAEQYLIYAEAVKRGGTGGDATTALSYLNKLRFRAFGGGYGPSGIGQLYNGDFTLQTILDERARELYWEGFRRTDLIRYGMFTTSTYLWPWKGGVKTGAAVDDYKNLYPIPSKEIVVNTNLKQNPGY